MQIFGPRRAERSGHAHIPVRALGATASVPSATHAIAIYKEGCDRGSGTCCSDLAWLYQTGCGVPKDKKRAKGLLRKAEQLGWVGGD
jgi:TPR repeat protein